MPTFSYRATNEEGREINGSIDAQNIEAAQAALRNLKYKPLDVTEAVSLKKPEQKPVMPPTMSANPVSTLSSASVSAQTDTAKAAGSASAPVPTARPLFSPVASSISPIPPALPKPLATQVPGIPVARAVASSVPKPTYAPPVFTPPPPPLPGAQPKHGAQPSEANMQPVPKDPMTPTSWNITEKPSEVSAVRPLIAFASPSNAPATVQTEEPVQRYYPLTSTLRLYAGWLLLWYGCIATLGYYSTVRDVPFDVPIVRGFFVSPLIFNVMLGMFLYLLLTTVNRLLRGGVLTEILILTLVGGGLFYMGKA